MQTNFTPEQRADPDLRLAESILRKCVHCGFCLATCPTYILDGDERDSPRGRIYLMKSWFETGEGAPEVLTHLDRCLTCGSCETTCPSGVDYLHLVDLGRTRLAQTGQRSGAQKLKRRALISLLTNRALFRTALALGPLTRPLHRFLPRTLRSMTAVLPGARSKKQGGQSGAPVGPRKMRVVLHPGCVQKDLAPQINQATMRVLTKLGCEVVIPRDMGCCGALADHLGEKDKARAEAARNIEAILNAAGDEGFDAIVSNASGCGVALKDYGHLFRSPENLCRDAEKIAALTLDISQLLTRLDLGPAHGPLGKRIAWQAPCTLLHGQRVGDAPKDLLRHFGYEVVEPENPHLCCGAAGTYHILQPKRSAELGARKRQALGTLKPDVVASGNIGCITGLSSQMKTPVRHMIELIDEALD